ncbi:hypothetical protein MCAP1_002157 [Malassezia caprae]|uniref:Uncharacterized protein n=1 Tax=Malassezia caprae TaxID=1381934 RepID=A0AAF0J0D1_9BASI|nr:hypothetical protein MCAP1_002157 [Malassezia caprae]
MALHALGTRAVGALPRAARRAGSRAYTAVSAAEVLRAQAEAGSNKELDPRGVDYGLFESPSSEYTHQSAMAPRVSTSPAGVDTMRRVLQAGDYAAAVHLFGQLRALGTPLGTPLVEYAYAARWCAASQRPDEVAPFLERVPPEATHSAAAMHQVAQALLFLARDAAAAPAAETALLVAADRGFVQALARALTELYHGPLGGSPRAEALWRALVPRLRAAGTSDATLAALFARVVRAQARARHTPLHETLPSTSAAPVSFALDARTRTLLQRSKARAPLLLPHDQARAPLLLPHDQARFAHYAEARDLLRMRSVLLGALARGHVPPVELLATLLVMASAHTHIPASGTPPCSTGAYLRPLRRRLQAWPGLWETALLRAREKAGDWRGALRLWQTRFVPSPAVRAASVEALLAAPAPAQGAPGTHAAAVAANSAVRPAAQRAVRARLVPTSYAVATALRALVQACGPRAALLAPAYAALVAHARGAPVRAACFEAFVPMMSRADPRRFVRAAPTTPLPTLWTLLQDMQACGVTPRATTWTLCLQALARARGRRAWRVAATLLRAMDEPGSEAARAFALPRATAATYVGVLHVLRRVRPGARVRRREAHMRWRMQRL